MKQRHSSHRARRYALSIMIVLLLVCGAPTAHAATAEDYIADAPISISEFATNPIAALQMLLADSFFGQAATVLSSYGQLFLFLMLGAVIGIVLTKSEWLALLELLVAGGSFLLISSELLAFAQTLTDRVIEWNLFLLGFVPVFAAVIASGGETVAASTYSGFFLICINALAKGIAAFLVPLIECYLALSVTSAFWIGDELPEACKTAGKLLKKIVGFAGAAFTFVFSIQRVFSAAADGVVVSTAKALGGAVPIIGQTVTSAATALFSGVQVLKTGLGFAAIAVILWDFLPLYLEGAIHLLLLALCAFLAKLFSLQRAGKLFDCLAIGMEAMLAILALFFFMVCAGTILMLLIGSGG